MRDKLMDLSEELDESIFEFEEEEEVLRMNIVDFKELARKNGLVSEDEEESCSEVEGPKDEEDILAMFEVVEE